MKTIVAVFCAIFLSVFLFSNIAVAQNFKSKKLFKDAEKAYSEGNYSSAVTFCKDALEQSSGFDEARLLLGKCYLKVKDAGAAEQQLSAIVNNGELSAEVKYYLALACKMQERYDLAIQYFDDFLGGYIGENSQTAKAQIEKEGAMLARNVDASQPDAFEFRSAGERINSEMSEFAVAFGDVANKIIVSARKSNTVNGENLKYLYAQGWMQISENDEFDFLNSPGFEGSCTMDPKGDKFYFTQCQGKKCRIMASEKTDGIWHKATALGPEINYPEANAVDPSLSKTGDTLFFATDRRGGIGDFDVWFSVKKEDGSWSDAINLGLPVNTPFHEKAPFSAGDGTFYFSSNGHPGFGGFDIFYVAGLNGKREIVNAGRPFNSSFDDQHIIVNDEKGYLSSDRAGGLGSFDIYTFTNNKQVVQVAEDGDTHAIENAVYSSLFASGLYEVESRLLPNEHALYKDLSKAQRKQLLKRITDQLSRIAEEDKEQIKREDKMLYASLSRDKKFFVDKLAAAYFESTSDILPIPAEDVSWFMVMELPEQRKLYRLMIASVYDLQQEFIVQNTPLIVDEDAKAVSKSGISENEKTVPVSAKPELSLVQVYENETYSSASPAFEIGDASKAVDYNAIAPEPSNEKEEEVARKSPEQNIVASGPAYVANKEQHAGYLEMGKSLQFYQQLPFTDKKRVDRIMAIKLVNEKYILNPGLSRLDLEYYQSLPASDKEVVDRLQLYFRSWDLSQESANLRESDMRYLSSLPEEKRQVIQRIIVMKGIGVDDEGQIKFAGADWERYKKFSEKEIEEIKEVAQLLKSHRQVFDVALAYAGDNYTFNNNLALRRSIENNSVLLASSDPEISIEGTEHAFESIYFDAGNFKLRKEALAAFNDLVGIYRQNPEISINLTAYSSDLGSEAENARLSDLRLRAAMEYLRSSGIPDYKIKSSGYAVANTVRGDNSIANLERRKVEISILNSSNIFQSENTTYLVQPGNTLYSLSKANGMSVEELMAMNGLTDYNIFAYQPLRVKKDATLDPDLMVEPSYSLVYGGPDMKSGEINGENSGVENDLESRGEEILVFQVKEEPQDTRIFHVVKKGEKLKSIARIYDVDMDQIIELNNKKNKRIKMGDRLLIKK